MFDTAEIIRLARQAHVPFGAHAFIVVQENVGLFAEQCDVVGAEGVEAAKKAATDQAAYRKARQPELDFHVLEVGAPVDGGELIAAMADLIDHAIDAHIYDTDNGDVIPEDCQYVGIVAKARAWMASQAPFALPPVGAMEIIADLRGSLSDLDQQVDQMKGMFDDSDGAIQQAQEEAAEALHRAQVYEHAISEKPVQMFVKVEGGNVQDVTCDRELPSLEVIVIDFDVDDEDESRSEIHMEGDRWETVRADPYPISIEAAPQLREPAETEA